MTQSGIKAAEEFIKAYEALRFKKKEKGAEPEVEIAILYGKIEDKSVELIKKLPRFPGATIQERFENFCDALNTEYEDEPIYVIYDLEYENKEGTRNEKPLFVSWCPDVSKIKKKMCHASSKDSFKKSCQGLDKEIHAVDRGDLNYEAARSCMCGTTK